MKKKFKAIITDVDGTLVANSKHALPTERVFKAVKAAQKKVHTGIATARCIPNLKHILDYVQFSSPLVLQGGACIYDPKKQTVLKENILGDAEIEKIAKVIKNYKSLFVYCDNESDHKPFSISKIKKSKAYMVFAEGLDKDIGEKLIKELKKVSTIVVHTTPSWVLGKMDVLITHPLATKQHGIFEIAKLLDIAPKDIIGIGDGGNDLPLLMACGLKVAMGNANDDLKAIADVIAPSVDEDGVAWVIEKYILD